VVLCPDPTAVFFGQDYYNHRDHRVVGMATLDAVSPAAALPHYFPDAGPAHQVSTVLMSGTLEPDVWVDVSITVDVKGEAVGCHRSQFPDGVEWARTAMRLAAGDAGKQAGVRFAEGFRRLRLGG
jgi:LmbE family N-acetylglucosaminyl deacetylase